MLERAGSREITVQSEQLLDLEGMKANPDPTRTFGAGFAHPAHLGADDHRRWLALQRQRELDLVAARERRFRDQERAADAEILGLTLDRGFDVGVALQPTHHGRQCASVPGSLAEMFAARTHAAIVRQERAQERKGSDILRLQLRWSGRDFADSLPLS